MSDLTSLAARREGAALVVRQRLVAKVRAGTQGRLTVLTAPAGYGKSVVVDHWLAQHRGIPVGRASFTAGDDLATAADRLVLALTDLSPPGSEPRPSAARALVELVADRAPAGRSILVLDAVDAPLDPAVGRQLAEVVDRAPANVHLVLTRRSSEADVRGAHPRATHLGLADLAFTPREAHLLVRLVADVELDDDPLRRLIAHTQGWAVGLQLAAIRLRTSGDLTAEIDGSPGAERDVAAYLLEQVLARQSVAVRRFLVQTSVLDEMTGPLCDEVLGDRRSGEALWHLEQRGIFTTSVAEDPRRFTYHPQLRELLRRELRLDAPAGAARLLRRAGAWFATHDQPEQAARYFIEAEDWGKLHELVEAHGTALVSAGRSAEVLAWLEAVPPARRPTGTVAQLRHAFLHLTLGRMDRAEEIVQQLGPVARGEQAAVDSLRSARIAFGASPEATIRNADAALLALTEMDPVDVRDLPDVFGLATSANLAMLAQNARARARLHLGDVAGSRRDLRSIAASPGTYAPCVVSSLGSLALLEAWAGNLRIARIQSLRALSLASRVGLSATPVTLEARLASAHILRERGDLVGAAELLAEVEALATAAPRSTLFAELALERSLVHLAAGEPELGLAVLGRQRALADVPAVGRIEGKLRAVEVRLNLALGARDRAELLVLGTPPTSHDSDMAAAAVHTSLARGEPETARRRLGLWPMHGTEPRDRLLHGLWTAIVELEHGERRDGITQAQQVVRAAEREGHVRLFLDGGRPAERLVRSLVPAEPSPYLRQLVRIAQSTAGLVEPGAFGLSRRELEVVRFLPTPLSSSEIASLLFISLNTLKTHLRTIYRKLGVSGRREAIERVEELGLA